MKGLKPLSFTDRIVFICLIVLAGLGLYWIGSPGR